MYLKRRQVNLSLIILAFVLAGVAVGLYILTPSYKDREVSECVSDTIPPDSIPSHVAQPSGAAATEIMAQTESPATVIQEVAEPPVRRVISSSFKDVETRKMIAADHPFRREAQKVLAGHLEETDSINRHRILSYCEHLRTSYTTRDIDFLRQVYSDDALIIVGHVVSCGKAAASVNLNPKVRYSKQTKKTYIERLARIFKSSKEIDVEFSDFKILRHPTMPGIYGVTLRQKYSSDSYSDDGFLFLLWDFRDRSMPLIHVRTWQPSAPIESGDEELIEISDFNLE